MDVAAITVPEAPAAVVVASDGLWEALVFDGEPDHYASEPIEVRLASACGPIPASAEALAERLIMAASRRGLNDNATVAVALLTHMVAP